MYYTWICSRAFDSTTSTPFNEFCLLCSLHVQIVDNRELWGGSLLGNAVLGKGENLSLSGALRSVVQLTEQPRKLQYITECSNTSYTAHVHGHVYINCSFLLCGASYDD